jgi:hypothetical protein
MQRRAAFIGLLTIVALLGACGGDNDKPTTLPSVSEPATSPAGASAPMATAATTPARASSTPSVVTAQEAVALARRFYEVITQVAHDGDGLERYRAVVHPSCEPCQQQENRLTEVLQNGQRVVGGDLVVVDTAVDRIAGNTALIRVGTRTLPGRIVDADGTTVATLPEDSLSDEVVTVALTPEGLRVVNVILLGERR